jgi:hypothetical protein
MRSVPVVQCSQRAPPMLPPKQARRARLGAGTGFRCYLPPHLPSPPRYATFPRKRRDAV